MNNKFKLLLLLPLLTLSLSGCDWFSKSQGPQPTPLAAFNPTLALQERWAISTGAGNDGRYYQLTPALDGDTLFVDNLDGTVGAVDADTGQKKWVVNLRTRLTSGMGAGQGLVFGGTDRGEVYALQQATGALVWKTPVSSEVLAAPVVAGALVLVKGEDDTVTALDAKTGAKKWSYNQQTPNLILRGGSSPQVAGNLVVVGFASGELTALKLQTGSQVWKGPIALPQGSSDIENMVDINDNIVIRDGVIYAATYQGNVAALALNTGQILWRHKLSSYAGLAVGGQNIYVADADDTVWAFDKSSGNIVWKQTNLAYRGISGPALFGNAVVVGDAEGYLHFLSRTDGQFLARFHVDNSGFYTTPVVANDKLYAFANSGRLAMFTVSST